MSAESWLAEFYPIPADKVEEEDALDQVALKWSGLLPENLERHEVELRGSYLYHRDKLFFKFFSSNCALCKYYLPPFDLNPFDPECTGCPLYELNNWCCSGRIAFEWCKFICRGNPRPMQRLIARAIKKRDKERKKAKP